MSQNEGFWTTLIRTVSAVLELRLKMPDPKRTLRVLIPIALLVLLLGSTLGAVWHHHANANTSSDTCVLCHLVIAPSVPGISACVLVPKGAGPEPRYISFIARSAARQIPARAPPA
jgi:hypothetical protein